MKLIQNHKSLPLRYYPLVFGVLYLASKFQSPEGSFIGKQNTQGYSSVNRNYDPEDYKFDNSRKRENLDEIGRIVNEFLDEQIKKYREENLRRLK